MHDLGRAEWLWEELMMKRQFLIDRSLYCVVVKKDHPNHGDVDFVKKTITLNDDDPTEMLSTLIHELVHALDHEYCHDTLKHWQVYALEKGITRFLTDNFGSSD